jgi:hypothetical protein
MSPSQRPIEWSSTVGSSPGGRIELDFGALWI